MFVASVSILSYQIIRVNVDCSVASLSAPVQAEIKKIICYRQMLLSKMSTTHQRCSHIRKTVIVPAISYLHHVTETAPAFQKWSGHCK